MRLDPGDEIRYFQKNSSGGFDLHKYSITSSYNIDPQTGVSRLLRDGD